MREKVPFTPLVRCVLVVTGIAVLHAGCKKDEQPAAPPTPSAPPAVAARAAPVPPEETYTLSNVRLRYDENESKLTLSYDVRNQGAQRVRALLCLDSVDKEGYLVEQGNVFDRLSLRAGDSDQVTDESDFLSAESWRAAEFFRLYVGKTSCLPTAERLSALILMDKSGQELPTDARPEPKVSPADSGEATGPWFKLEEVQLTQNEQDEVTVAYKVTNLVKGRVTGHLCVRLIDDKRCDCKSLDYAESPALTQGSGASERRTSRLELTHEENWDKGHYLVAYMAQLGCTTPVEQSASNVLTLLKPRNIHAPAKPEEPDAEEEH
ncbi:hypothetical protein [Archangium primigenium]|uniref:hypothetical protein n=1 Tax=[Archangium] primigenium TaxID=2792470 RepID=UPI0019564A0C|nr:hypothetical protein [Archangium primigenium]MBM7113684.1 hypothetical protein [Archangium primigenium]